MPALCPRLLLPLALVSLTLAAPAPAAPAGPGRPNVLLMMADDLGFSDLGCYGGEIRTPNLDRLASDGMRFTQFYNAAVCWDSRSACLAGLYPRPGRLEPNMVTTGDVMKEAGYRTALIGKWHTSSGPTNHPNARGFEEFYGFITGEVNYFRPSRRTWDGPDQWFHHNARQLKLEDFPPGYYTTDAFSEHAAGFIRESARAGRPFFINLCYNAPHTPLHALPDDIARYRGRYREGYFRLREERLKRQFAMGFFDPKVTRMTGPDRPTNAFYHDYDIPPWEALAPEARRYQEEAMEVYAAVVDRLDQGVGRVLAALEETGQAQNTIVLFVSDNGGSPQVSGSPRDPHPMGSGKRYAAVGPGWGWAQNAPFRRHKAWTYEGGICTPMIVRWPGKVRPGAIVHEASHLVDVMPTLLEIIGSTYPRTTKGRATPPLEGRSLVPVLREQPVGPRPQPIFFWEFRSSRALREGHWKIVWGSGSRRWELYNLAEDRAESTNLASREPERLRQMVAAWEEKARTIAPLDFDPNAKQKK